MLDGAVTVFDSVAGVEPQTETVWRQANKYGVPRFCFVNKMDRIGANFYRTVDMVQDRACRPTPLVVQLPDRQRRPRVERAVHRSHRPRRKIKALIWHDEELGAKWDEVEIPAHMADQAAEYREHLLETIATEDEHLMEKYLGGEELTEAEIKARDPQGHDRTTTSCRSCAARRSRTRASSRCSTPSSTSCRRRSTSRPPTAPTCAATRTSTAARTTTSFAALAFKIVADPFGKLTYFRVYSGEISKGEEVYNSTKERRERLGRILLMHANQREDLDVAMAGDIVAGLGFKEVTTGDTLCDRDHLVILERMEFPEPVIHVAIEPKTKSDQDKLGKALKSLSDEDPTFRVRTDEETGQTIISGMGELHLEVLVDRMVREFNVEATVGKPQVAYRETVTKKVESVEYRHIKQSGGSGQFAVDQAHGRAQPGQGLRVRRRHLAAARIPREYINPTNQGIQSGARVRRARRLRHGRRQGRRSSTASTTTSTRRRWRSRSPARWASRKPPPRPAPCCSSRSWRSRSSRPRTTWAT